MTTTLADLATGHAAIKYVACIEGYKWLLTDADTDAAVTAHAGHSGGDWTQALGGLFVDLQVGQRIDPYDPFTPGGSCTLSILNENNGDQFGVDVYRRSAGVETVLTGSIDRNDAAVSVASNVSFTAAPSELHCGTECIEYSSKVLSDGFIASKRGKYSPFPAGATGSPRFGNHHRISFDKHHVQLDPVVSQLPRVWLGRRVGVWMHTVDADGTLNSYADAQCVFAGILVGIADDANSMCTRLELKHMLDVAQDSIVGGDIFGGEICDGVYLAAGRTFAFRDLSGTTERTANVLTVVASGATGANQIDEGNYGVDEICAFLSKWLASELTAGRIFGYYSWQSPLATTVGWRTRCSWRIENASYVPVNWTLDMPGEVAAFLGMKDIEGSERGQTIAVRDDGYANHSPHYMKDGDACPFHTLVFKPAGPGGGQEFSEALVYRIQNARGVFVDQFAMMPAAVLAAASSSTGHEWGIFLIDEKTLVVAAYDSVNHEIEKAWLAPWRMPGDNTSDAITYVGRRMDEPENGPVSIRQVYVLTGSAKSIVMRLFYGSGTSGYNHATYDDLGPGLGVGIPGGLLGAAFDLSVANLPSADAELAVIFDESTTLPDLIASDLLLRRTSLRWKNEGFEFVQWQTPVASLSVATLTDANKAEPAGHEANHRAPTLETTVFQRAIVKIDYQRDFSVGRNGDYSKSIQLEDQVAVDDAGGETRPLTIKARNTYSDFAGTGSAIEELTKTYLATMPQFSRSARHIKRSIDMTHWETLGVGDIVTVTDTFARDPATGLRGINSRYGTVMDHTWDPGGVSPDGSVRPMTGEVEIRFPDVNRHLPYAPAARVDIAQANGGYDAGTKTLTCVAHQYSEASEAADAAGFPATYKVTVVELDAADPATAQSWDDTVASQTGNAITLTTGLAGWVSTKRYMVTFDKYSDGVAAQHDFAHQADTTDHMVEDIEAAYQYSNTDETLTPTANTGTDKAVGHADIMFGDGRCLDAGSDAELINFINMLIDRKTAHQSPTLDAPVTSDRPGYQAVYSGAIYCGMGRLGNGVTRTLTVAPWLRSSAGGAGNVRVTLSRLYPQEMPGETVVGYAYLNTRFGEVLSSATWTTSSATWSTGADQTLSLGVKDLQHGYAWLTIEVEGEGSTRGLAKCIEGPRTVI